MASVIEYLCEALKSSSVELYSALDFAAAELKFSAFKDVQKQGITSAINGRDVFVCVPTGSGKSAIYEALTSCARNLFVQMGGCHLRTDIHPFVLVVSPLASLMQDQVAKLNIGRTLPRAVYLCKEAGHTPESVRTSVLAGDCTHIFTSPEAILSVRKWRDILFSDWLSTSLLAIAVDEAHCIIKW